MRDDPTKTPWTVSIATMPGEEPCPQLEALDAKLRWDRDSEPDPHIEDFKARIEWLDTAEYGPSPLVEWMSRPYCDSEIEFAKWLDWLTDMVAASFQVPKELIR